MYLKPVFSRYNSYPKPLKNEKLFSVSFEININFTAHSQLQKNRGREIYETLNFTKTSYNLLFGSIGISIVQKEQ